MNVNKIIVHCSDSYYGDTKLIREWHLKRGFVDIGYHYVILNCYPDYNSFHHHRPYLNLDGTIEEGRPLDKIGAHCESHNHDSVGVCLIGRDTFTSRQILSLIKLIDSLQQQFANPPFRLLEVAPHHKYNGLKTCPNLDIDFLFKDKYL